MTAEARTIPVVLDPAMSQGLAALEILFGMDGPAVLWTLLARELRAHSRPLLDGAETAR